MKILSSILVLLIMLFGGQDFAHANEMKPEKVLTAEQKKEIASLQRDILTKRKEIISKYVKYGVITKEKGDAMIVHLQEHYDTLEKNGFIHKRDKHHQHIKENTP
ncbi:YckD family protein [Ectobacillus sp. sgz5001026]|uniref:YckD family protein n=1 Tax=Ectobacillus sp. sgz5001026 TaxID=3242473 RepID=UPI0036D29A5B